MPSPTRIVITGNGGTSVDHVVWQSLTPTEQSPVFPATPPAVSPGIARMMEPVPAGTDMPAAGLTRLSKVDTG